MASFLTLDLGLDWRKARLSCNPSLSRRFLHKHHSEALHMSLLVLALLHCSGSRQLKSVVLSVKWRQSSHHESMRGAHALLQGADWFESVLVDYDVCSNWGNWVAAAGLTGGRVNHFNITKQSKVAGSPPHVSSQSASGLRFQPVAHHSAGITTWTQCLPGSGWKCNRSTV